MTLAAVWIIAVCIARRRIAAPGAGLALGALIFVLILPHQQNYVKAHPGYLKALGDAKFQEFISNKE